jgi:hypothetical protein
MVAIGKKPDKGIVLAATNGRELEGTRDEEGNAIEVEESNWEWSTLPVQ